MSPICLPIVVQVYEFHGKSEKLKKIKLWITTNKKLTKKICSGKFTLHIHNPVKYERRSLLRTWLSFSASSCFKLTIKSKGLVKKTWKWLCGILSSIYCLFKMNPTATYEKDYYIFEQEIIFILSRAENVQNRNFWKQ